MCPLCCISGRVSIPFVAAGGSVVLLRNGRNLGLAVIERQAIRRRRGTPGSFQVERWRGMGGGVKWCVRLGEASGGSRG